MYICFTTLYNITTSITITIKIKIEQYYYFIEGVIMRYLSATDIQDVSGGIGFTFVLAMLNGASGGSRRNTTLYDGLWWGTVGFISGIPMYGIGAFVTGPVGFACGAVEGYLGYTLGSLFKS